MKAPLPGNETERLANLRLYDLLDTLPEEEYDDIVRVASQLCGTPVSMISLIDRDRQWYKSTTGVDPALRETGRDVAFCAHNILVPETPLVVRDLRQDERFADNPFVTDDPHVVFYAGVPLVTSEGFALGSLCVIDVQPRELSQEQLDGLRGLSRQVTRLLDLRLSLRRSEILARERAAAYDQLRDFSHIIAHDLKAPLRNIGQACGILSEEFSADVPAEAREMIELISVRAQDADRMIRGVLRYSEATRVLTREFEEVDVPELIATVSRQLSPPGRFNVEFSGEAATVRTSRIALWQILQNLIDNAMKHHDKPQGVIQIHCRPEAGGHRFTVRDDGPGIPKDRLASVFNLFYTSADQENREDSHGVGLSIVSRLVGTLGGDLEVKSTEGEGTEFSFFIRG